MAGKNIVLLYISEVSGHHSATIAIEKAIRAIAPDNAILNINAFRYTNPVSEKIVNKLYTTIIKKTPKIWDYMYDNPRVKKRLEMLKNTLHKMNSPKFKRLFDRFNPDVVVCTQAFPCGMVADYKRDSGHTFPLIGVLTDFVPHSYWLYDTVDYYVTPCEEVSKRMVDKGIPHGRIRPLGIPFNPEFMQEVETDRVRASLGFSPYKKTILIMGGGQGLGPIQKVVESLETVDGEIQEIVICGINKKLRKSLEKKRRRYKQKIAVFGYTKEINELMSVSDLIITKPGGITTSEALAKSLPMIIINPIPGQEMNNANFLTVEGAAIQIDNPAKTGEAVSKLLSHPEKLSSLRDACRRIRKPDSAIDIANFVLGLASKNIASGPRPLRSGSC